jgi:hypothetical protein
VGGPLDIPPYHFHLLGRAAGKMFPLSKNIPKERASTHNVKGPRHVGRGPFTGEAVEFG